MSLCTRLDKFCRTQAYNAYSGVLSQGGRLGECVRTINAGIRTVPEIWNQVKRELASRYNSNAGPESLMQDQLTGALTVAAMNVVTPSDGIVSACIVSGAAFGYTFAKVDKSVRHQALAISVPACLAVSILALIAKIGESSLLGAGRVIVETGLLTAMSGCYAAITAVASSSNTPHIHSLGEKAIRTGLTAAAAAAGFSVLGVYGAIPAAQVTGMLTKSVLVVIHDPRYRDPIVTCFQRIKADPLKQA